VDRTGEQKTRSVIHSGGGVFAYGSSAIAIERGDSSGFLRTEIVDVRHGSTGSLDRSGYHSYEVIGQWDLAGTRASGGFSHRGTAGSLAGGEEQAGKAESGFARIMRTVGRARVEAGYERGYDGRESFGGFREFSRRDAESTLGYLGASMPIGRAWIEARLSGGQSGVERSGEGVEANDASWGWGSVALAMPLGPGSAHVTAGVGRHGAFDHFEPSLSVFYETGETLKLRAGAERLVRPIWTDLGIGEDPFIQSTWAGVLSVTRLGAATRLHGYVTGGHCRDRALAANEPLEDLWLRDGLFRDPETYTFFLTGVEGQWRAGPWTLAGEGFAIGTNGQSEQPRYDPDTGGRAEVVYRTTAFKGDLGIMMRAGVEYVGSRESLFFVKRTLPGYATSQVGAALSLVDATVTLLVRNLEDQYHELPWINTLTFSEALTTGREWRLFFTLRLSS
jgi:hypothetical protein